MSLENRAILWLLGRTLLELALLPWHIFAFLLRRTRIRADIRAILERSAAERRDGTGER